MVDFKDKNKYTNLGFPQKRIRQAQEKKNYLKGGFMEKRRRMLRN